MIPGNGDKEFYDTIPKGEEIKINGKSRKKVDLKLLERIQHFLVQMHICHILSQDQILKKLAIL